MEEMSMVLDNLNGAIQRFEDMQKTGNLLNENELATAYTMRGLLYFQINKFDESISDLDKSIEIMERLIIEGKSPNANELNTAYSVRGMTYHIIGENEKALPDITKSIDILEHLHDHGQFIEVSELLNMYLIRGEIRNRMYDCIDDAISDYHKSIVIAEKLKLAKEPLDEDKLADAYMGIAGSYDQKSEFAEANKHYGKCIDIWERFISEGQPLSDESNLATAYMNRGINYHVMGENVKALSDHNKCISIRERLKSQGVKDAYFASLSYRNRAVSYKALDNKAEAIKDYISAIRAVKEEFNERSELQGMYYKILTELIDLVINENNNILFENIIQEYLYSMRSIPKTEEAEEAQNNILERLENVNDKDWGDWLSYQKLSKMIEKNTKRHFSDVPSLSAIFLNLEKPSEEEIQKGAERLAKALQKKLNEN